ncbi:MULTISPECIES: PepSY domain-containing protein [unclassified Methylobacterium]|uniref:PepSY domain-containing protein n=1 Tax=unclassified Methylobacterium TaxID=2615210 RepID=UPI000152DCEF|nr:MULTISPECIES: PepSY domain-containing protein [Methylobacterium]WFT78008.1 PepSY domain-containing protein [Methylobacterium nodulans]
MRHAVAISALGAAGLIGAMGWYALAQDRAETGTVAAPTQTTRLSQAGQTCLSPGDLREAVAEKRVVEPVAAIRAAQAAVPRADIVRANLCRRNEALVYMLTALRRDGQFVHVVVDARSGQVAGQW